MPSSPETPRKYALRFISGKYQGGEYAVGDRKEIIVGRSSDLDMVLVEDMVSRRHARIGIDRDQRVIEDLGSTNGTFVNGQKIKRVTLKEGDRVLIGTSILKVVVPDRSNQSSRQPRKDISDLSARPGPVRTMSGSIDEIPLPDLLQLLGSSKKSGVLVIRSPTNEGRIFLRKGIVYFASMTGSETLPPLKSVFRMLGWTTGTFDLEPPDERTLDDEISATVQEILMESLRQLDELSVIRQKLPDDEAKLGLASPMSAKLRDLTGDELEVLQVALEAGTVGATFDRSPLTDLATAQILIKLFGKYLRVQE